MGGGAGSPQATIGRVSVPHPLLKWSGGWDSECGVRNKSTQCSFKRWWVWTRSETVMRAEQEREVEDSPAGDLPSPLTGPSWCPQGSPVHDDSLCCRLAVVMS